MKTKVYVSPSTQEKNLYAFGNTSEEVPMNAIADIYIPELIRHGVDVMRNKRTALGTTEIVNESNAWGADYHIAIHSNAFNKSARGCEVYCFEPTNKTAKGTILATEIYDHVTAIMPVLGRGVKSGAKTMSEIAHTNCPSALIEIDYHDTIEGAKWILNNISSIAQALLMATLDFLAVKYIPKVTESDRLKAEIAGLKTLVTNQTVIITKLQSEKLALEKTIVELKTQIGAISLSFKSQIATLTNANTEIKNQLAGIAPPDEVVSWFKKIILFFSK